MGFVTPLAISLKSVIYGVFCLSVLASKVLLLRTHFGKIPTTSFILYLPTLLLSDCLAVGVGRLLLPRKSHWWSAGGLAAVSIAAFILLGGAASQIGFYAETGGNIDWRDASAYTADYDGLKVLLSGLSSVGLVGGAILAVGVVTGAVMYRLAGSVLLHVWGDVRFVTRWCRQNDNYSSSADLESVSARHSDMEVKSSGEESLDSWKSSTDVHSRATTPLILVMRLSFLVFVLVTFVLRPEIPYNRLSVTLPVALLGVFELPAEVCFTRLSALNNPFPLPDLITSSSWRKPKGNCYKGWAPSISNRPSALANAYKNREIDWIPQGRLPRGFARWDPARLVNRESQRPNISAPEGCILSGNDDLDVYYNPISDPLKVSNLDADLLPALREALGDGKVKINHVVMILMEGIRQDVWPLQKGSHFYDLITKKTDAGNLAEVDERLSQLSPHIERITGTSMGFLGGQSHASRQWTDSAEQGNGGVNIIGAYTAATTTLKSFEAIHCGTPPLPIDGFVEAERDSYQPCLPQIFEMLNLAALAEASPKEDYRNRPWKTALFQATTEQYDHLDLFDSKLGYHHRISRKELENDGSRFNQSDILYQKVNYFAYPEPVLLPYMNEFIDETLANRERLFLAHMTSTSHHRWDLPKDYPTFDYMPYPGGWGWRDHLNKYLNTVRYHDEWMGTLLKLLDDKGIANETLVVFVGDHGLSFMEDSGKEGTYENDHLSNLRVGLTFRHPHLPRVQYEANMTTISVLPTILDLLVSSGSLNEKAARIASDLVNDYEGQSLIRPYKTNDGGRRAWSFTVINPGGRRLSVISSDAPWKLVVPLSKEAEFRVVNAVTDPNEQEVVTSWNVAELIKAVHTKLGEAAAEWVAEAVPIGKWWALEKQRLWQYNL